jgi:adenylate kinase
MLKFIFIGAPGVGKGTYAKRISPQLGIPHISSGDLFRAEMARGSELGKLAKSFIDQGQLVPDEVTIKMMKERLARPDAQKGFILDGFPRNLDQAKVLEKITPIDLVLHVDLPETILIKKICARRTCEKCGDIYNVADIDELGVKMPAVLPKREGTCDQCGSKLIQRSDDTEEMVRERLKVYHKLTDPIIAYYTQKGLVKIFRATAGPELMVQQIMKILKGE